jgi:hypothetical protein
VIFSLGRWYVVLTSWTAAAREGRAKAPAIGKAAFLSIFLRESRFIQHPVPTYFSFLKILH